MTELQIAELRKLLREAPTEIHDFAEVRANVLLTAKALKVLPKLLDEREALLNAAKEAAEGFDVVAADDARLLALLRDAIAKAESP